MGKILFTADNHFGHSNIIKYCNRPFKNVEEMNKIMIEKWNKKVSKEDTVYIIGDYAFKNPDEASKITDTLNGNKFLIKGNHDLFLHDKKAAMKFGWVKDYYVLNYNGIKIVMFHYPMFSWDTKFHGSIQLYGHIHNGAESKDFNMVNTYNVGVDLNNYEPISVEELMIKIKRQPDYYSKKYNNQNY